MLLFATVCLGTGGAKAQTAQLEKLDRGIVAVRNGNQTFVSWRLLENDDQRMTFDLLRDGTVIKSGLTVANCLTTGGNDNSLYEVVAKVDGQEISRSKAVTRWIDLYKSIKLDRPASQADYHYFPNDCSVGDLDGDGEYEMVIKWDPSNNQDNSKSGKTGNVYLDAYKLDGTKLWRIDLGQNIRAGAHYTQFLVYDFNNDGTDLQDGPWFHRRSGQLCQQCCRRQ